MAPPGVRPCFEKELPTDEYQQLLHDKPHIGHAYTTVLADVLARYHRSLGDATFFLTGTDEHGQKVEKAAAARHMDPKAHCDETVQRFQSLWKRLGITNDRYIRTTDE